MDWMSCRCLLSSSSLMHPLRLMLACWIDFSFFIAEKLGRKHTSPQVDLIIVILYQSSTFVAINEPILIHYFINNNHIKEIHTTVLVSVWILQFYWFDKCKLSTLLLSYRMVIPPWKSLVPHLCIPPLLYLNPGNYWSWPCSFCFSRMSFINSCCCCC